jgi:bifunctional enzyme CysN/CysC
VSRIEVIVTYPEKSRALAAAGDSIALRLTEQIFVERGEIISVPDQAPEVDTAFVATIVWFSADALQSGFEYLFKIGTTEVACSVSPLNSDNSLPDEISNGDIAEVAIRVERPVAFDRISVGVNKFVICSKYDTVAAGTIASRPLPARQTPTETRHVSFESGYVEKSVREKKQGHKGAVVWLTGLSGSGKSTVAKSVENRLFAEGKNVIALDADNLRMGLGADLGFSQPDRTENIRRIAEVAKLSLNLGAIVLVACLSPYARDRELARIGSADFFEVFISCPIDVCRGRDPKGLYRKVSEGKITSFTGLDSPYQPPAFPSLLIDSSQMSLTQEVAAIMSLLQHQGIIGGS